MSLTAAEIIRLARLARMEISPEEIERFRVQLSSVLENMKVLEEIDLGEEVASGEVPGVRLREDESRSDPLHAPLETLSTDMVAGFFTVPRALPFDGAAQ